MVKAATFAAVNASISTPVFPVNLQRIEYELGWFQVTVLNSLPLLESNNGWQRGISSQRVLRLEYLQYAQ